MNAKLIAACLIAGALMLPLAGHAADLKSGVSSSETFVKDSIITTQVKSELAGEKLSSLVHINVDTDNKGVVTLSGNAASQMAIDKAVAVARGVHGVTAVTNHIQIAANK